MSPVISPITSLQFLQVGLFTTFQPALLSGTAASWQASALPPGLAINTGTGLISGTPTQPCQPYDVTVTAFANAYNIAAAAAVTAGTSEVQVADTSTLNVGDILGGAAPENAKVLEIVDATHFKMSIPTPGGIAESAVITVTPNGSMTFAVGVVGSQVVQGWSVQLLTDWDTKLVTPAAASAGASTPAPSGAPAANTPPGPMLYGQAAIPVLWAKTGDTTLLDIALQKSGVNQQPDIVSIELSLKSSQDDSDPFLTSTPGNFVLLGQGGTAWFRIAPFFDPDLCNAPIQQNGEDYLDGQQDISNTVLYAYAEIRFGISVTLPGAEEPSTVYSTTRTFIIAIEQSEQDP